MLNPYRIIQHHNPGRLLFGLEALKKLPQEIPAGLKPLIVTDPGLAKAGLLKQLTDLLDQAGRPHAVFDRTVPDPSYECVAEAAEIYRSAGCSALVALGGGSSMDAAKAVGVSVNNPGQLADYLKKPYSPLPFFAAVPTTAGTGSEATGIAVISNLQKKVKEVFRGPLLVPQLSLLDPKLLSAIPPRIAAETGADALTHAVESHLSRMSQPVSEALALQAIRLIGANLRKMVADPSDPVVAGEMLLGSYLAGLAFTNSGLGLSHALAHPVGAHFHLSHGRACALFLPYVLEFNLLACPEKLLAVGQALGENLTGFSPYEAAAATIEAVRDLLIDVGLPQTYSEAGVKFELKPEMVEEVMGTLTRLTNPRQSDREDIKALFQAPADRAAF